MQPSTNLTEELRTFAKLHGQSITAAFIKECPSVKEALRNEHLYRLEVEARKTRPVKQYERWNAKESKQLIEMVRAGLTNAQISLALGRSVSAVAQRKLILKDEINRRN